MSPSCAPLGCLALLVLLIGFVLLAELARYLVFIKWLFQ